MGGINYSRVSGKNFRWIKSVFANLTSEKTNAKNRLWLPLETISFSFLNENSFEQSKDARYKQMSMIMMDIHLQKERHGVKDHHFELLYEYDAKGMSLKVPFTLSEVQSGKKQSGETFQYFTLELTEEMPGKEMPGGDDLWVCHRYFRGDEATLN